MSLAERIAALSDERRRLFERRLLQQQRAPIPRLTGSTFPLSFAQTRLWFLDQLAPGSPAYNLPVVVRLRGRADVSRLACCLAEVARRHSVLRTTFASTGGEPVQQVHAEARGELAVIDLRRLPVERREHLWRLLVRREAVLPFDLAGAPAWRARLLRLAADEQVLALTLHHIVADGWSLTLLLRELAALYTATAAGAPAALPELPIQYADYAVWQRQWLAQGEIDGQLAYWRQQLSGAPMVLELPTDRPRFAAQTWRGACCFRLLPPPLTLECKRLSQRASASLFTTLLAVWSLVLHRLTGSEDLLVGSPSANRERDEVKQVIGFFVNNLTLRAQLGGNPPFAALLGRLREVVRGAQANQELPFERLVEVLQPSRDLGRSPLFQVMLSFQNVPRENPAFPGLTYETVGLEPAASAFEMTLTLAETGGGLAARLDYSRDLFDAVSAERCLAQFARLAAAAVALPDDPLSALDPLSAGERHQLLTEWNDTAAAVPAGPINRLLEAQVERAPDRVAVVHAGSEAAAAHLSYAELNRQANRLAHHLRGLGLAAEQRVALCSGRSPEVIVALLAILKAGCAYVPLDPRYPLQRLGLMLEDAAAGALIANAAAPAGLTDTVVPVALVGPGAAPWRGLSGEDLAEAPAADALAYVIYTSGSTGRPKGVQVAHRALVNFLAAMRRQLAPSAGDRLLAVTSLSFDIAGLELWLPLLAGATVEVVGDEAVADGGRLRQLLARGGASFMQATPSTWQLLLEAGWQAEAGCTILCGGEALPYQLAARLSERGAAAYNLYGPTETTIWSALHRLAGGGGAWTSLGRPLANTQLHCLDRRLQPVAIGAVGELLIGGAGLARGYLGRPDLTAERFVPDPFSQEPGARLYRTGDLARRQGDGTIEFCGRLDHQVKIRGFRIELGEIEAALARCPGVQEAVVVARRDNLDDPRLVAYVAGAAGQVPEPGAVRALLREWLPEHMVPPAVVRLDALPRTPNGKLDRRALPAPRDGDRGAPRRAPPRSAVERTIAKVWAEVLRLDKVGVEENFFELGGHSLLLPRVRAELEQRLGRSLELVDLFRHPTVSALARYLAAEPTGADEAAIPRSTTAARGEAREVTAAVAIVGMAGRFPGARNLDELWANLRDGVESISFFTTEELLAAGVSPQALGDPAYVRAKGVLAEAEWFDAPFFNLLPRDAELMDPQHRVFLECAWEALENAGCDPGTCAGAIGVYAGAAINSYWRYLPALPPAGAYQMFLGNDKDFLATRLSYKLNLRGPSVSVQTACSTSLVAVHMAAQSLLHGECDVALAGGVAVSFPRQAGYFHSPGMIFSPDGHCRAFDARAAGTVFGEGVGVVVLKRLADALAEGDCIRAVVKGSAVNNDGAVKVSYTAPSVEGQASVIAKALAAGGVDPATIGYVETHGTGTPLGDPLEFSALCQAFASATPRRAPCLLGALKTNVGHLDTAAGIAGLIKTVLCLEHAAVPPVLHFQSANPQIALDRSPFRVPTELRPWPADGGPRRAGVSSFGIGGTNAHVVLEQAPRRDRAGAADVAPRAGAADPTSGVAAEGPPQLLLLSARTAAALEQATDRLASHLAAHPELPLADVAYTLQVGRRVFAHRRILLCRSCRDAATALAARTPGRVETATWEGAERPVAFLLPGQVAELTNAGIALYRSQAVFRAEIERCAELLADQLQLDLRELLYPATAAASAAAAQLLRQPRFAEPALLALEVALAATARQWGVRPAALLGHAVGEYAAAHLAGILDLADALALAATRGRWLQDLPPEALLGEKDLAGFLGGSTGGRVGEPLRRQLASIRFHPPRLPLLSSVTGTWLAADEATAPEHWVRQALAPARLAEGARELLAQEPDAVLAEVGPGEALCALLRQQPGAAGRLAIPLLPMAAGGDAAAPVPQWLGPLWLTGAPVDWHGGGRRARRVPLPTYPFERQRLTLERSRPAATTSPPASAAGARSAEAQPAGAAADARQGLLATLYELVQDVSGLGSQQISPEVSFVDLGVDSLLLIQFTQAIERRLGIQVAVVQLLEEITTLDALAGYLERELAAGTTFEAIAERAAVAPRPGAAEARPPGATEAPPAVAALSLAAPADPPAAAGPASGEATFGPYLAVDPGAAEELTPHQQGALTRLIERYTTRTAESKRRAAVQRPVLADNRAATDFRLHWKEMVYPIIGERSTGSRLWDVDGNEYVDVAMGFGVHLFGHSPGFVQEALREQLGKGLQLGPQSELAGEVAAGIAELTGMERVAFSNTGTEAVMAALRVARAVTGRSKIALFAGSYHGSFDGVLARCGGKADDPRALPVASGVLPHQVADVLVVPYGEPTSLAALAAHAGELAAVLVEPVQSRRPELQPRQFLHDLRRLTAEAGVALIFDEVITGFRIHPGGCQAWFGVQADLATFGKVLGGGMPIGVIAGRAAYLDAIDGGAWEFGDRSFPRTGKTFFAGTFCKHPLAMAAARAVLRRLHDGGPRLQQDLNRRTEEMAGALNGWLTEERTGIRVAHFGSLFRFTLPAALRHGALFYFHLLDRGVFTWEGRTCFLSTAHDGADVARFIAAVQASVLALRDGGFLPEDREAAAGRGRTAEGGGPAALPVPVPAATVPPQEGQREIWLLSGLSAEASRAYNESKVLRLTGAVRPAALRAACQELIDRHQALRAAFSPDGEQLWIAGRLAARLPEIDLGRLTPSAAEELAARLARQEAASCFVLDRAPLLRMALLRLSPRQHLLVITCHHAVLDGRSMGLLLGELELLYEAAVSGRPAPLAPAAPLRELLGQEQSASADGSATEALDYWRRRFAGQAPVLELPCDQPRPASSGHRGGFRQALVAAPLYGQLRRLAADSRSTLFGVLFAGWSALMHRLSGQDSMVVGVPSSGVPATGAALGYGLRLLPIRSDLPSGCTFASLLVGLRNRVLADQQHRDFSFGALLQSLGLRFGGDRPPLVTAAFNLDHSRPLTRFGDLAAALATNPTGAAKFELDANATDDGEALLVECVYNRDLFAPATVARWLAHYQVLLAAAAADPRQPVAALPLLGAAERHQLVCEWNDTGAPAGQWLPVHHRFERQARITPGQPAVAASGAGLTYAELDRRANAVARRLRALGIGLGACVALFVDRTPALAAGILGIWKAGGHYLPLDPASPQQRLAFMIEDSAAAAAVSEAVLAQRLAGLPLAAERAVYVGDSEEESVEPAATALRDPAYVIYTSGSTGRPKAVLVDHGNLAHTLDACARAFDFRPGDRTPALAPFSFDIFLFELLNPLLAGGAVEIFPLRPTLDLERLLTWLPAASQLHAVPAVMRQLLDAARRRRCQLPGVREVYVGGDAVPPDLLAELPRVFPAARSFVLYGPTEASIICTCQAVSDGGPARSLLGRPLAATVLRVVDAAGDEAPIGVTGEIWIGGGGVSGGYRQQPTATADKFRPAADGRRWYRTGDLGRRRHDGICEFAGRTDQQVKVRGFRIELGEIESRLVAHPEVRQAVVLAREQGEARRLVAYVVPVTGSAIGVPAAGAGAGGERTSRKAAASELSSFLGEVLPDYMLPSGWVWLDAMPLLTSGKVDRRALAAMPLAVEHGLEGSDTPRTPAEELLCALWSDLLGIDRVGAHDDFFALGGHSLLATRVISRVRETFAVELPLREVFEHSTVIALAARLEQLRRGGAAPILPPIERTARRPDLPLSFSQQRLWFLDQLDPGNSVYNIPCVLRLRRSLDIAALRMTCNEIVRRHEVLRTTITLYQDAPVQRIAVFAPVALPVCDLSALAAPLREAHGQRLAALEVRRPFALEADPLLRVLLIRLDPTHHLAVLTMHHIASDGWSMGILVREVATLYEAFAQRRPSPLPELAIQYADFAVWQRAWMQGPAMESHLSYWQQHLGDPSLVLELPTDRPRPPFQGTRGEVVGFELPRELALALNALGRREGATLFMVFAAAFQALLARYSGQREVRIGTSAACRDRVEIEDLIGFFVNTLVLRAELPADGDFRRLLAATRASVLEACAHQDLPFERLVNALQPDRAMNHAPLFQALFAMQKNAPQPVALSGLDVEPLGIATGTAKFDLTLEILEAAVGLTGTLEFNTDLFDRATAMRLAAHLQRLCACVAAEPEQRLWQLDLLSREERFQVLVEWNDTAAGYAAETLVHQLFEAQVKRAPDAAAVVMGGEQMSYGELNRRSNLLAHRLIALGVGPGARVAVFLTRSPALLVAVLGTLKAGAAYVPIPGSFPRARRQWVLDTLRSRWLLTDGARLADCAELAWDSPELGHLICLGRPGAVAPRLRRHQRLWTADEPGLPDHDPPARAEAADLAYVIFTSGSTGTPKGVEVQHRPVVNLIAWVNHAFALTAVDRVLFVTSLSFDLSVYDVFGVLAAGGSIQVATEADLADPERLYLRLCQEPITLWDSAPAALQQLAPYMVERAVAARQARLRLVLLSGDWIPVGLPGMVQAAFPRVQIVALGGATEAVVWSNFHRVIEVAAHWVSIPYGRPIQNAAYHVLDGELAPCPIGVAGDLYIGGDCLAAGYAAEPALTAEKFIPDPRGRRGGRLYRTGDRARYWSTGQLEFLGRRDRQVKIRGFRIELGEIETHLAQHPGVQAAAAVVLEDRPGQRRLVAYMVPRRQPAPAIANIIEFLAARLPDYMLPGAIVSLGALPLTPNGKLDAAALPTPDGSGEERRPYIAPRTPAEKVLAGIWAELLGVERVGIHDRFLELGGDSILSIQVVARARRAGLDINPRQLYEQQTIAALLALAAPPAVAVEQAAVSGELPLTPAQRWLLALGMPDLHHFNQSLLLASRRRLAPARVVAAVARLVAHHDALRLRLDGGGASRRQHIVAAETAAPFLHLDLAGLPLALLPGTIAGAAAQAQASLDLRRGPLLRVVLFTTSGTTADRLLVVVHHLAVDGVSWRILLEDLEQCYERGDAVRLPAKTASFKRWAEELAARAASAAVKGEVDYWLSQGERPTAPLSVELAGANTVGSARTVEVVLDEEETRAALREVVAAYRTEINDLLLTAVALATARWSGRPDLRLDLEWHGREPETAGGLDVSRTVGWFTAIFPVCLSVPAGSGPGEALLAIKEQLRAVPGRGLGYGLLRYLNPCPEIGRRLGSLPAAEMSFNFLGQLDRVLTADAPFAPAPEGPGPEQSPRQTRPYLIEISSAVAGGRLRCAVTYSANRHHRATVEALAQSLAEELRRLIRHCLSEEAGGFSAADFPLARLDAAAVTRLAALLAAARGTSAAAAARQVEDVYPLSPLQETMLFHTLSAPASQVGVEQLCFTLRGALDPRALERAWRQVVARHAALRTLFLAEGLARPLQVVLRHVELTLSRESWHGQTAAERQAKLTAFLAADRQRGFRPERPPLLRVTVIELGPALWQLVWTHHHLILDGWCATVLLQEVLRLYAAAGSGQALELEHPRPYRDYIAWLERQDPAATADFWRRTFAGYGGAGGWRVDRLPDRAPVTGAIWRAAAELDEAATAELRGLAQRHGVTLSTAVQAGWAVLASRYGGCADVVFGTTVSGRPPELPGSEAMIGMFINNLPVRLRVDGGQALDGWLRGFQEWQQELRQHEGSDLRQVQEWSGLPPGRRLFDSLVVFQNLPREQPAGASVERVELDLHSASLETAYPLTLVVDPGPRLSLLLVAQQRGFDAATAQRLVGHLAVVLAALGHGQAWCPRDLPLLSLPEHQQLLVEGAAPLPGAEPSSLVGLFAAQAERQPDAVAVSWLGQRLSYGELAHRARRLADRLRRHGAGPEVQVGLCAGDPAASVVGALAILAAGGACLPLAAAWPATLLDAVLAAAAPRVLVTTDAVSGIAAGGAAVVAVGETAGATSETAGRLGEGAGKARGAPLADQLAWSILDGGRVAAASHRGLVASLLALAPSLGLGAGDRCTCLVEDWGLGEPWCLLPLLAGAQLELSTVDALAGTEEPGQAAGAGQAADARQTTGARRAVLATAAQLQHLVSAGWQAGAEIVLCTDQELPRGLANAVLARGCTLWCCGASALPAPCQIRREDGSVLLGPPLAGQRFVVLDRDLLPLPAGVPGDLCLSGRGGLRQYVGDAALTAAAWLPDPLTGGDTGIGARIFRTGWLARRLPQGGIELLGRRREPAEAVRGAVETGELEALLRRHPALWGVAVAARCDAAGEETLASWIVADPELVVPAAELGAYLRATLPERMIPAAFIPIMNLPLGGDGRLDRQALPDAEAAAARPGRTHVAPRTSLEHELALLWGELFDRRPIGVRDSFFDLGGHSLLAVRLMTHIRSRFGQDLPLATLFAEPTIEQLAQLLRRDDRPGAWSLLVTLQARGSRPPLFFVHPAGGGVLTYVELTSLLGRDQPSYGLQARGQIAAQTPIGNVEEMAALYCDAIRAAQGAGPYLLAGSSFGGYVAFEMARQLDRAGEAVELVALLDTGVMRGGETPDAREYLGVLVAEILPQLTGQLPADEPLDRQLAWLLEGLRQRDQVAPGFELADLRRYFDVYWTHILAAHAYAPRPYRGRVVLFRAMEGGTPALAGDGDPTLGWAPLAGGGVEVEEVPGTHFNLTRSPHVQVLAGKLRGHLDRLAMARQRHGAAAAGSRTAGEAADAAAVGSGITDPVVPPRPGARQPIAPDLGR
jgi:amino acid adenylation domain-containing protein/non-ribosomal peptide synthase protein (TIGR01720 family)